MPYTSDLDEFPLVINAIDNPVRSDNDLTDNWLAILRDNPPKFGELFN